MNNLIGSASIDTRILWFLEGRNEVHSVTFVFIIIDIIVISQGACATQSGDRVWGSWNDESVRYAHELFMRYAFFKKVYGV